MNKFLALALGLGILTLSWFRTDPVHAQQWLPGGTGSPIVCVYNSSPPTVATGLFLYAQCDTNGKLITSGGGGGGGAITSPLGPTTAPSAAVATTSSDNVNVTPTDCSISSSGSAQNIIAAATTRHGATIANIDPTTGSGEPIWISFTGTASANTTGSYPLAPPAATTLAGMGSWTSAPGFGFNHAISVIATTGHKISCTVW